MRLDGKVAIVVGAGQTPGDTIGNGRATAILFAREGAKVMLVDRDLASAEETAAAIRKDGGDCKTFEADITTEADCHAFAQATMAAYGFESGFQYQPEVTRALDGKNSKIRIR